MQNYKAAGQETVFLIPVFLNFIDASHGWKYEANKPNPFTV